MTFFPKASVLPLTGCISCFILYPSMWSWLGPCCPASSVPSPCFSSEDFLDFLEAIGLACFLLFCKASSLTSSWFSLQISVPSICKDLMERVGGLGQQARHFLCGQELGLKPLFTSLSLLLLLRALSTTGALLLPNLFFGGVRAGGVSSTWRMACLKGPPGFLKQQDRYALQFFINSV